MSNLRKYIDHYFVLGTRGVVINKQKKLHVLATPGTPATSEWEWRQTLCRGAGMWVAEAHPDIDLPSKCRPCKFCLSISRRVANTEKRLKDMEEACAVQDRI